MNTAAETNLNKVEKINLIKITDLDLVISVKKCDLLMEETNVIVNASNTYLLLGAGISGAIKQKGGKQIQIELDEIKKKRNYVLEGEVEMTNTGNFKNINLVKIFHAVGPKYSKTINNDEKLKNAFKNCLLKAENNGLVSISIPPISSGIFGYPIKTVSKLFYDVLYDFITNKLKRNENFFLKEINYCNNEDEGYEIMTETFNDFVEKIRNNGFNHKIEIDYIRYDIIDDIDVVIEESKHSILDQKIENNSKEFNNQKGTNKSSLEVDKYIKENDKNNKEVDIILKENKLKDKKIGSKKKDLNVKSNSKITEFFMKK